jgi:hypothetical protein
MPGLFNQSPKQSQATRGPRPARMGAIGLTLLFASGLAAAGCGETTHPASTAAAAHSTASTGAGGAQGTTTTGSASAGTTTASTTGSSTGSNVARSVAEGKSVTVAGKGGSKAHLVLPGPNSKPAPKKLGASAGTHPVADISLSSPALSASGTQLPARYTCAGADESLPLHWSQVPAGTQELVLFVVSEQPVDRKLFFDWALGGLNPSLQGLGAGQLPAGATIGRNGYGHEAY